MNLNKNNRPGTWLMRLALAVSILASVGLMYYVDIIKKDYVVFTNPDGPTQ